LKKLDDFCSVRVGIHHRALGVDVNDGILWFWIGTHAETTGSLAKDEERIPVYVII
jgi:hypothetical protein